MDAVDPLVPAGAAPAARSPLLYAAPQGSTGCPLCPTGVLIDPVAAVLLEADWLQLRTASVKIDLQQPRSEVNLVNLYVKFWAGLGWAGPGWAGLGICCTKHDEL